MFLIADCFEVTSVWRSDIPFESTRVIGPACTSSESPGVTCLSQEETVSVVDLAEPAFSKSSLEGIAVDSTGWTV